MTQTWLLVVTPLWFWTPQFCDDLVVLGQIINWVQLVFFSLSTRSIVIISLPLPSIYSSYYYSPTALLPYSFPSLYFPVPSSSFPIYHSPLLLLLLLLDTVAVIVCTYRGYCRYGRGSSVIYSDVANRTQLKHAFSEQPHQLAGGIKYHFPH